MQADIFVTGVFVAQNGYNILQESERQDTVCLVIGCGPVGLCVSMLTAAWRLGV